jgi:hypothetical protein
MKFPNYTLGLFTGFCLAGLWFLAPAIIESFQTKPAEAAAPTSNFTVVETYKGCDVVRYTVPTEARYHYFLDCTNELLMGMPYGGTSIKARKEKYD